MPSLAKLVSVAQTHDTFTANGAVTHSTSQSQLVDLFFIAGTLIGQNPNNYMQKWYGAYAENKELAMRLLFWMRDVRGGAGVRDAFNYIYHQLSPEDKEHYAKYIPVYGRWKDVFEQATLDFKPFEKLIRSYFENDFPDDGLFCKWFPRKGQLFETVRKMLHISPKELRKLIVTHSQTVEQQMSANQWQQINYGHVPSKAMAKYSDAFTEHDQVRFLSFLEAKPELIKSSTLYPADLYRSVQQGKSDTVINTQWKNLPDYIQSDKTFLPVVDVSGSMFSGRGSYAPIMNSISLGLYLAERNKSVFKDAFISFSMSPKMHYITGDSVADKFRYMQNDPDMGYNTDIQATFDLILNTAIDNRLSQTDLPDYVIILSDMEFDDAQAYNKRLTNFEVIKQKFQASGFTMPNLIFWNLNGRIGNVPVTVNDQGVALVSGYSPAIMKSVLSSTIVSPYEVMIETLDNERYKNIN